MNKIISIIKETFFIIRVVYNDIYNKPQLIPNRQKGNKMNRIIKLIKKTFFITSALYMLSSLFIFFVFFLSSDRDPAFNGAVSLQMHCLLFSFISACGFSAVGELRVGGVAAAIIEFVISFAAFWFSIFYLTGNSAQYRSLFAFSTVFVIVYAVCGGIAAVLNRLSAPKKEYERIYSEKE